MMNLLIKVSFISFDVNDGIVTINLGLDFDKNTMVDVYAKFDLEPATQDFIGKIEIKKEKLQLIN